ncbi:MAG: 1,4-dihydroxy-2-naphthoate octaprenyltransferase [Candidatus Methanofastidiosum methylothiophilum]|uniref:1,4-dihydroxy-2-naphthoate octaprenyltransferase n=1 Tax=Candidatus Methanofastidiosum methylothiophilum TaxID=1705564 RepID=A0A150IK91_9EURY|nr:MAG: 1,4-dihydroxy-2-naphthoate octaprenyltransferase [Candidatus Methanofastidiosum methylthiophilus]KYC48524.1 MAG: 1,4-dihydroxy-2-naphthoate octaprenyltransferase [Candidatus Methanofastidiosum methylthiophilus]KYC51306.1 MAG: 1,4-dihydroxy-2-naphthoate octaprenyltransferase [Candidatus Methanofastidiosum methylthiophilus]
MISKNKIISWIKLMRLEFYSMPFVVYSLGALISYKFNGDFLSINYILGYLIIFLIELLTVFTNEYYDFETDKLNKNPTRFTGGSRMLVENKISIKELKTALLFVLLFLLILSGYLLKITFFSYQVSFLLVIGIIFGVSYTTPPLKFSYRGVGELDVAFIHGFYVILCGYVFQKGILDATIIWVIAIPIFFSSLVGVSLAGITDIDSDIFVSKKSIVVLLGPKNTLILSTACSLITGIFGIYLYYVFSSWQLNFLYLLLPLYSIYLSYNFLSKMRIKNYEIGISKMIIRSMILIALSSFIPLIIFI